MSILYYTIHFLLFVYHIYWYMYVLQWYIYITTGDPQFVFSLFYLLSGVLGVLVSDFFFAFQLLDVIPRSKLLQYVLKSVTQNGISIILTVRKIYTLLLLTSKLNSYDWLYIYMYTLGRIGTHCGVHLLDSGFHILPRWLCAWWRHTHVPIHAHVFGYHR